MEKHQEQKLYDRVVLSTSPAKNEHSLHGCEPIYILSACNIQPVTQEDLWTEFVVKKLQHPVWKDKTFKRFLQFKAEQYETKYNIETYDTAYFLNPITAFKYAEQNMADINESGSYPFIVIYTRPTNHMYAETNECYTWLFAYDRKSDTYKEIEDVSTKEEYQYLISKFNIDKKPAKETIDHLL